MGIKGIGDLTGSDDQESPSFPTREEQEKAAEERESEKEAERKLHNEKRISKDRRETSGSGQGVSRSSKEVAEEDSPS
jgi:hypothetical protein